MSKETNKISIEITKNLVTLEMEIKYKLEGNKIDIIEAFILVLKDSDTNELQDILLALREFS